MKSDAIAFGIAGVLFGLIAGWVIGSQQAIVSPGSLTTGPPVAQQQAPAAGQANGGGTTRAAILDEAQVNALKSVASREPSNATPRVQLGNLYFDAERYEDAIKWYEDAVKLSPRDVNLSTDLGVSYYYLNQADRALEQFSRSLTIDPKHAKTLLNLGIVKAFGKQDLQGAAEAWQQVIALAPNSPEAQAARRALDSLQSAHPATGGAQKPSP
jgi:tetratricopeptide (TPR) repeat protein